MGRNQAARRLLVQAARLVHRQRLHAYVAVFVDTSVSCRRSTSRTTRSCSTFGFEATSGLKLGNDQIEFKARFGGSAREIVVPIDHVVAIYARENGQGMAFPVPSATGGISVAPLES
jgi:stringent starvation protein B